MTSLCGRDYGDRVYRNPRRVEGALGFASGPSGGEDVVANHHPSRAVRRPSPDDAPEALIGKPHRALQIAAPIRRAQPALIGDVATTADHIGDPDPPALGAQYPCSRSDDGQGRVIPPAPSYRPTRGNRHQHQVGLAQSGKASRHERRKWFPRSQAAVFLMGDDQRAHRALIGRCCHRESQAGWGGRGPADCRPRPGIGSACGAPDPAGDAAPGTARSREQVQGGGVGVIRGHCSSRPRPGTKATRATPGLWTSGLSRRR